VQTQTEIMKKKFYKNGRKKALTRIPPNQKKAVKVGGGG
jgi:hypothetical protein